MVLRPDLQRAPAVAHERAPAVARARFAHHLSSVPPQSVGQGRALTVAIAVVTRPGHVLLVCRRDAETSGLSWALLAGQVEPGESGEQAAVRETREETGLEVAAVKNSGERTHSATGRRMIYAMCEIVASAAYAADPEEFDAVA